MVTRNLVNDLGSSGASSAIFYPSPQKHAPTHTWIVIRCIEVIKPARAFVTAFTGISVMLTALSAAKAAMSCTWSQREREKKYTPGELCFLFQLNDLKVPTWRDSTQDSFCNLSITDQTLRTAASFWLWASVARLLLEARGLSEFTEFYMRVEGRFSRGFVS